MGGRGTGGKEKPIRAEYIMMDSGENEEQLGNCLGVARGKLCGLLADSGDGASHGHLFAF